MTDNDWLVRIRRSADSKIRIVCFPHAGAGPSVFRSWEKLVSSDVELLAVSLPGREHRICSPFASEAQVLAGVQSALGNMPPLPTCVFGHSFGALLGYEFAKIGEVDMLIVSGCPPPKNTISLKPNLDDQTLERMLRSWNRTAAELLECSETKELILGCLRDDLNMFERIRRNLPITLNTPIHTIAGVSDRESDPAVMENWREHTHRPLTSHVISGGHFFPFDYPRDTVSSIEGAMRSLLLPKSSL